MKGATRAMNVSVVNRMRSKAEDIIRDRKLLIRILTVFLILLLAVVLRIHEAGKADITVEATEDVTRIQEIYVDIGGAVVKPGVYKASSKMRLYEVIEMAGGLRSDADTDSINQAAFVEDGQKIIIPVQRAAETDDLQDEGPEDIDLTADNSQDNVIQSNEVTGLVNINTASRAELMTLSGIGEVMADRIIEYRSGNLFRSIEDIKSVKGIGEATYNKIKDSITV